MIKLVELLRATRDDDGFYTVALLITVDYLIPEEVISFGKRTYVGSKPTFVSLSVMSQLFDTLEIFPEVAPARGPIG